MSAPLEETRMPMYIVKSEFGLRGRRAAAARRLDATDLKILAKLQSDGRITTVRLAEHVNLSPSACHERVTYLTARGYIKSFRAEIDLQRIVKYDLVVVEITLGSHHYQSFDRFEKRIAAVPEIVECIAVGGGIDYILKFAVTSIAGYQELLEQLLQDDIGIKQYFSYVVTKVIKPMSALPIEHLHARARRDVTGE
jgi:Lrp/AsnC family transcriptional regulator of ectoine degradation